MLFSADAWPGIADGTITLTFRRWTRPQAKVGGRYRVAGMLIEALAVDQVDIAAITDEEANAAGAASSADVIDRLGVSDTAVWRVEFRYLGDDDRIARRTQTELTDDAFETIRIRLGRWDRASPWTRATLALIECYPGVVSTVLARHAGMERQAFKLNVRKLKELGLTESLDTGYRLSPLGEEFLRRF
jgi:hypothetical protein